MGYASMIMDETTPNDLLTSPELSPTKLARQRDSQCLDEEDEEEAIQDQDNDHDDDAGKMTGDDGEVKVVVERRGREEEDDQEGVKEGVCERTFVADDDLSLVSHRKEGNCLFLCNRKQLPYYICAISVFFTLNFQCIDMYIANKTICCLTIFLVNMCILISCLYLFLVVEDPC